MKVITTTDMIILLEQHVLSANTTACRIIVVSGTHRERCFVPAADGGYPNASQVPGEHSIVAAAAAAPQRLRQS